MSNDDRGITVGDGFRFAAGIFLFNLLLLAIAIGYYKLMIAPNLASIDSVLEELDKAKSLLENWPEPLDE